MVVDNVTTLNSAPDTDDVSRRYLLWQRGGNVGTLVWLLDRNFHVLSTRSGGHLVDTSTPQYINESLVANAAGASMCL